MALADALQQDRNPAAVYLAGLGSNKSRRAMRGALALLAAELGATPEATPWASLRYQHAQALRARLAARLSPATVNHALCALRGVLRESMRLGLMSAEDCARACDVQAVRGYRLPPGRALDGSEVRALFTAAPDGAQGTRDAALVAVLYGAGLRRAEVAALDVDHLDRGAVRVLGKGNKERRVYLPAGAVRAVEAWLLIRGASPGPLFSRVERFGRVTGERLAESSVAFILARLAERAGVEDVSPHDLRRSMISDMLDAGVDVVTVAARVGHASPTTTARYDRRGDRAQRRAAAALEVPSAIGLAGIK